MPKNKLIFLMIFLLIIPITLSNLQIEPTSVTITSLVNQEKYIPITLTNNFNFKIVNINFSENDFITYPLIDKIEKNQSIQKNIKILTTNQFDERQINSVISFKYYSEINLDPETYNIEILDTEYKPQNIEITIGDSITWTNNGSLQHTITSNNFDYLIQPNGTKTITFNEIDDEIDYYDKNIFFHGYIKVKNLSQELTYNQDYNKFFTIFLNSLYETSTLEMELLRTNFSIEYDSSDEGIINILNNGNKTAINVTLNTDSAWIKFSRNNFNISPNSERFVTFEIIPLIYNTSATDRTYYIEIKTKAENTDEIMETIKVFIPYNANVVDVTNKTKEELIDELRKLKDVLSNLDLEDKTQETKIVYRDSLIGVNYTEKEVQTWLTTLSTIKQNLDKSDKFTIDEITNIKTEIDFLKGIFLTINQSLIDTRAIAEANQEKEENRSRFWRFLIGIIVICGMIIGTVILAIKTQKKEQYLRH